MRLKQTCETLVNYLLISGVSANEKDKTNKTALMYAAESNDYYVTKTLLENGAGKEIITIGYDKPYKAEDWATEENVKMLIINWNK